MEPLLTKKEIKLLKKIYKRMPELSANCPKEHLKENTFQLSDNNIPPCKRQCCNNQIMLTYIEFAYVFDYVRELLQDHPEVLDTILNTSNEPYCIFLSPEEKCLVYDARPYACRCFNRPSLMDEDKCIMEHQKKAARNLSRLNAAIKQQTKVKVNVINKETGERIETKNRLVDQIPPQFQATFEGWIAVLNQFLEERKDDQSEIS